ncbi:hypothetical protein CEXT_684231 [Caerostris extrusa]|uniref:Uncharacterized protein n=1 Tax=Caerostris extrusa TaxID=172846 RepID=A0AAV4T4Y5_CAEEX|nr:hypothetical protein CEXT_684231 [Caerostris extrusa]
MDMCGMLVGSAYKMNSHSVPRNKILSPGILGVLCISGIGKENKPLSRGLGNMSNILCIFCTGTGLISSDFSELISYRKIQPAVMSQHNLLLSKRRCLLHLADRRRTANCSFCGNNMTRGMLSYHLPQAMSLKTLGTGNE